MSDEIMVATNAGRLATRVVGVLTTGVLLPLMAGAPAGAGPSPDPRPQAFPATAADAPSTPPAGSAAERVAPKIPFRTCDPVAAQAEGRDRSSSPGNDRKPTTTTSSSTTSTSQAGEICGDGRCAGAESCGSCPGDCGRCNPCGDGFCSLLENCLTCRVDCPICRLGWGALSSRYTESLNEFGVATDSGDPQ